MSTIQDRPELVHTIFHEVCDVINRHKVRTWLDQGVLLGFCRANHFIPHDVDIDFGIRFQDIPSLFNCIHEFQRLGYDTRIHCCDIGIFKDEFPVVFAMYQLMPDDHYVHIDYPSITLTAQSIWYWKNRWRYRLETLYDSITYGNYHLRRDKWEFRAQRLTSHKHVRRLAQYVLSRLWHLLGSEYYGWRAPRHYFDVLKVVMVDGNMVYVPHLTEEYLAYKYGQSWRIPTKQWNYLLQDGASVYTDDIKQYRSWHTLADYMEEIT